MKSFLEKNAKFSSAWGSAPVPSASGGFTPRPPLASVGWDFCPQTPQTAPHYEFLAMRLIAAAWIRPLSLWPKHYAALPPYCINLNTMSKHFAIKKCPLL